MKKEYVVYFTDGSSEMVEIELPAGAHPDSPCALQEVVKSAEYTGKTVSKAGRHVIFGGKILSNLISRETIFK